MPSKILLFLLLSCLFIYSCKKSPCDAYNCINGDKVEQGDECVCECETFWEGADCNTTWTAKLEGDYEVNFSCGSSTSQTLPTFIAGGTTATPREFSVVLYSDYGSSVQATLDDASSFTIHEQVDKSQVGFDLTYTGSGTISGTTITISYHVVKSDDNTVWDCTATYLFQ